MADWGLFVADAEVGEYIRYRYAKDDRWPEIIGHTRGSLTHPDAGVFFRTQDSSDAG